MFFLSDNSDLEFIDMKRTIIFLLKKTFFILTIILLIFTSCKDKRYSNEQRKVFSTFNGNFQSYIDREMIFAVISFVGHYSKPKAISEGKKVLFYAHGDCFFSDAQYAIPDKGYIECYYTLSKEADAVTFYYKGGANNKQSLRTYSLVIKNNNTFSLMENGRVLVFERVR
jgi:hypothetical protein